MAPAEAVAVEVSDDVQAILDKCTDLSDEEKGTLILKLVEEMNVLGLNNLVKLLEDVFGVSAAAPVAAMAAPAAAEEEEEEKVAFDVVLKEIGDKKINVIKAVRSVTSLGLKEAKDLVEKAPTAVKEGLPKDEAEKVQAELEDEGATVELE